MGFLDSINNIKDAVQDRLQGPRDEYYDDYDEFDDDYPEDEDFERERERERRGSRNKDSYNDAPSTGTGLLGNPSRPTADSVNVFTRSGNRVEPSSYEATANSDSYSPAGSYRAAGGAYRAADESWRAQTDAPRDFEPAPISGTSTASESSSYVPAMTQPGLFGATGNTPADRGLTAVPRTMSGKLPAYVLRPNSYDDVQTVVRRVRTNQPVVLSFKNLKMDTAKRILDFSFGLACGIDGSVEELGDRVFVVLPHGVTLSDSDKRKLRQEGILR